MNWNIQAYVSDIGDYFVTRRSVNDWVVLDSSGTIYDGFTDQNAAMSFAESLAAQSAPPPPPSDQPPAATPVAVDLT